MCQWRFIDCTKNHLMGDVDKGEAVPVGAGGVWGISVPSSQISCEPKTTLKKTSVLKKFKD